MQSSTELLLSSAVGCISPWWCCTLLALANLFIACVLPQLAIITRCSLRIASRYPRGCTCSLLLSLLLLLLLLLLLSIVGIVTKCKTNL